MIVEATLNATKLRSEVASYRLRLRNKPPKLVTSSPNGPVDMDLIDVLVEAFSSLERRIDAIEVARTQSEKTPSSGHRESLLEVDNAAPSGI